MQKIITHKSWQDGEGRSIFRAEIIQSQGTVADPHQKV